MTMTAPAMTAPAMTAPAMTRGPERRVRRRTGPTVLAVLLIVLLLAPVAYLFSRLWAATSAGADAVGTERAAVAYARPLNKLLAALVDAQYAAVRRADVDTSAVKAAIDEANAVDRRLSDPLQVRARWAQLTHEIDGTLHKNTTGPEALREYASSIALTQALLERVADGSKASRDPGLGPYHLTEVALEQLPEAVANAGQLAALAVAEPAPAPGRANRPDPRVTVAADRLAQAAEAVRTGLRSGTDQATDYAVDLRLLGPLDEFAAATDDLSQTADGLDQPGSGARDHIDAASSRVKAAALTLGTAVLNAFDAQLTTHASGYSVQRRVLVLAGLTIALAAGLLLWLRVPGRAAPADRVPEGPDRTEGRHGYPAEPDAARPEGPERIPDLVDARELLAPELVPAGRPVRPRKRQDRDDHR
jgi:hypothetical protein